MTNSIILRECSVYGEIEILGHVFRGLDEIKSSVEMSTSPFFGREINPEFVKEEEPEVPIKGIHVAEIWKSYPCFDFEDRMNEHRSYQNYFFSTMPFTPERLSEIYKVCNEKSNFALVNEDMPVDIAPAVYFDGDYGNLVVATTAHASLKRGWLSKLISKLKK